jgi:hypothetical protein
MFFLCMAIMIWCGVWMMPEADAWKQAATAGSWFSAGMILGVIIKSFEKPWR